MVLNGNEAFWLLNAVGVAMSERKQQTQKKQNEAIPTVLGTPNFELGQSSRRRASLHNRKDNTSQEQE